MARAGSIAGLYEQVGDDAMEGQLVVVAIETMLDEVCTCLGCLGTPEADIKWSMGGLESDVTAARGFEIINRRHKR